MHSDEIDRTCRQFLRQMIVSAQIDYYRKDLLSHHMTNHVDASILPEVMHEIEKTEEWKAYQNELLGIEPPPSVGSSALGSVTTDDPIEREFMRIRAMISGHPSKPIRETTKEQITEPTFASQYEDGPKTRVERPTKRKRLSSTITSETAAKKLERFLERSPIEKTVFAGNVDITPRTLLNFRRTGKIKRDTLRKIAEQMGTPPEELLKPD